MRLPKLLNADFEQSLNLLDDSLVNSYKEWWDGRFLKKKYGIAAKTMGYMGLLFLIWMNSALSTYFYHNPDAYTAKINFFPPWLCWIIMAAFLFILLVHVYGMGQNWKCMKFYNCQVRGFWFCLSLILALDLFSATVFTPIVSIHGMAGIFAVVIIFLVIICRKKVREITVTLYDLNEEQGHKKRRLEKVLNFKILVKAGSVLLIVYYIYKFIFWTSDTSVTPLLAIGAIIGLNIYTILMELYLFFPCVIQGYYRNKYAEEYRDWEGKTQIEWYGEKYFNKHIKGTEKEKKD